MIDDEEFCLTSTRAIISKLGIDVDLKVDFCMNGQEAIDLLKETKILGITYKMILTDFNMPVMDGVEATKLMRKVLEECDYRPYIIGCTGYATSKYHDIGKQAGMDDVYSKPMYNATLKHVLDKYYYK